MTNVAASKQLFPFRVNLFSEEALFVGSQQEDMKVVICKKKNNKKQNKKKKKKKND